MLLFSSYISFSFLIIIIWQVIPHRETIKTNTNEILRTYLKLAPFKSLPPSAAGTLPERELPLRFLHNENLNQTPLYVQIPELINQLKSYSLRNAVNCPRLSGIDPLRKL